MNENFKIDPKIVRQVALEARNLPPSNPFNLSSLWLNGAVIRLSTASGQRLPVYISAQAISKGYNGLTFRNNVPLDNKESRNLYVEQAREVGTFRLQPAAAPPATAGTEGEYFSWITGFSDFPNRVVLNRRQIDNPTTGSDLRPIPGSDVSQRTIPMFLHQFQVTDVVLSPDQPWTGRLQWFLPPGAVPGAQDGTWGIRNDRLNENLLMSSTGTAANFTFEFEVVRWSPAFVARYIAKDPLAKTRCCLGQFDQPNTSTGTPGVAAPDLFLTETGCIGAGVAPRQPGQPPSAACNSSIATYCKTGRNMVTSTCTEIARDWPSAALDDSIASFCRQEGITTLKALDESKDLTIKGMCACHLPDSQYAELERALKRDNPSLNSVSFGNTRCLVPDCAVSSYSSSSIRTGCKGVTCISAINFAPGTAQIGKVEINSTQTCAATGGSKCTRDQDCPDSTIYRCESGVCVTRSRDPPGPNPPMPDGGGGGSDSSSKGAFEWPWAWWVFLIIGLVLLVIVGVIVYAARRPSTTTS